MHHFSSSLGHQKRFGLFSHDSYFFSVAFFALLNKNKTIVLPNNPQKERLASLDQHVDVWLRDDLKSFVTLGENSTQIEMIDLNHHDGDIELWTSGSTGNPKMVSKKLPQLLTEVEMLHQLFPLSCDKVYSTIPHFHIYGLLFKILWPVMAHRSFNRETSFTLEDFQAKSKQQDNYLLVSCPAHLKRLPDAMETQSPKVQFEKIFSSGGACDQSTSQWWSEHLQDITEIFGSTETGGVAYRIKGHQSPTWTSLPKVNLKVKQQTLMVHSPFTGTNHWVSMGDEVDLSEDQRSFILKGRGDRIVKVQEKRISLIEMENHLKSHPDIDDAFIFLPNDSKPSKQRLSAVVSLSQKSLSKYYTLGHRPFCKVLEKHLSSWFESITLPKSWRVCREIPHNATGKRTADACQYMWQHEFSHTKSHPYILNTFQEGEHDVQLLIECPYHLTYFKGHFPNHPILAGVVQLHWAKVLSAQVFKTELPIQEVLRLKFKAVMCPGDRVTLSLKYQPLKRSISFQFRRDTVIYSSGTLKLETSELQP